MPKIKFINGDEHDCLSIREDENELELGFDATTGSMKVRTLKSNCLWWEI